MAEVTKEIFEKLKTSEISFQKFKVISGSMEPLIPVGETVLVHINAKVKRFDIVAFWGHDKLICHVLWHFNKFNRTKDEQIFVTCPLNGRFPDLSIRQQDILGPVVNYRLSFWHKLRMSWNMKSIGR